MRRATRTLILTLLVTLFDFGLGQTASAQTTSHPLEVGGVIEALRLSDFKATNAGLGGRLSYDFADWAAVEGEFTFFPNEQLTLPIATPRLRVAYRRQRVEALIGLKAGIRGNRFGVFGKVRPGVVRSMHQGITCVGELCALVLLALPRYRGELAVDLGGVLEFYPSRRTVARLDIGDTLIRHRSLSGPSCASCTSHNFTSRVGMGFRF